jgi:CubicO group peptidase (beta-lactamase class C family)
MNTAPDVTASLKGLSRDGVGFLLGASFKNCMVLFQLLWLLPLASATSADDFTARAGIYLDSISKTQSFSGTILVAHRGRVLSKRGYGFANAEWSVPNTPQTKFEIGSLTKQFTATAILQLVQAGRLRLESPVAVYIPDLPQTWSRITIHHLLTHTSGIPNTAKLSDYTQGLHHHYTPEELIGLVRDRPLDYEPGAKWKYSNTDYYLLGYLIERISAEPYAAYLQQHLFGPLAMTNTGYNSYAAVLPRRAMGYADENGQLRNAERPDPSIPFSAGAVFSTVEDLFRWDEALYAEKIIKRSTQDKMFTSYKQGSEGYGYGWFLTSKDGRIKQYHEGSTFGFASFIARYPNDHLLIVVLSNQEGTDVKTVADTLARLAFDELK